MTVRRLLPALFLALAVPATAEAFEYASSDKPYWKVGTYDKDLSKACRARTFTQKVPYLMTIGFNGKSGYGVVGVATKGFNLKDPDRLSQWGLSYHFVNDGYSTCKVYIAGRIRRR